MDEEIELVIAKALYGRNYYPGRKIPEVLWPPRTASQTAHYIKLAKAVVEGLRAEGYLPLSGLQTGSATPLDKLLDGMTSENRHPEL